MGDHLVKHWLVYVMGFGFIYLVASFIIAAKREEKKDREREQNKQEGKK